MNWFDDAAESLSDELNNGEISESEYHQAMRELQDEDIELLVLMVAMMAA
jgi:hypothetical protein